MVQGLTQKLSNHLVVKEVHAMKKIKIKIQNFQIMSFSLQSVTENYTIIIQHFWFPIRQNSNSTLEYNCAPHSIITNRLFAEKVRENIREKT